MCRIQVFKSILFIIFLFIELFKDYLIFDYTKTHLHTMRESSSPAFSGYFFYNREQKMV